MQDPLGHGHSLKKATAGESRAMHGSGFAGGRDPEQEALPAPPMKAADPQPRKRKSRWDESEGATADVPMPQPASTQSPGSNPAGAGSPTLMSFWIDL